MAVGEGEYGHLGTGLGGMGGEAAGISDARPVHDHVRCQQTHSSQQDAQLVTCWAAKAAQHPSLHDCVRSAPI
jgi:hypothetical protein